MKLKIIFFGGILLSLIIRAYFILNGSEVADVHSLREMGEITLAGNNPYTVLNYNSYPPLALYLEIITIRLTEILHLPFYILIKFWPNLADLLTGLLIFWALRKNRTKTASAITWSLIFLLNPISIIISSAHGQIDSIPTLLTVIVGLLLQHKISKKFLFISALLLGLAISIKPNPLFLVPIIFAFIYQKTNLQNKVFFLLFIFIPLAILIIPFLQNDPQYVLTKLFNYSGSNDFGLSPLLKMINFRANATLHLPYTDELLRDSKVVFLILLAILAIFFRNSKNLIKPILVSFILFLTIYFGISAQYLSWILPFAILEKDKMIFPYTLFGLIAMLGFYMYYNPTILLARFSDILPYDPTTMSVYVLGNLVFWLFLLIWLISLVTKSRQELLKKNTP